MEGEANAIEIWSRKASNKEKLISARYVWSASPNGNGNVRTVNNDGDKN